MSVLSTSWEKSPIIVQQGVTSTNALVKSTLSTSLRGMYVGIYKLTLIRSPDPSSRLDLFLVFFPKPGESAIASPSFRRVESMLPA